MVIFEVRDAARQLGVERAATCVTRGELRLLQGLLALTWLSWEFDDAWPLRRRIAPGEESERVPFRDAVSAMVGNMCDALSRLFRRGSIFVFCVCVCVRLYQ